MKRLANVVWKDDSHLSKLLSEWASGQQGGPMEKEFKEKILSLAWDAFETTLKSKGNRVMGALYYNRGLILMERNDLNGAKKEFMTGLDEVSRDTFADTRNELTVYCTANLGIIAYKQTDYPEALKWFRMAEKQQSLAGANWMPTLSKTCKQLEDIIASKNPQ